ncbi:MAG: Gfo/Idh/MocA family oxidoreductase [Deltaproteobacteria bacterium]|nr:Gfo/Idh/MocA family oxidoreductase [Deltaproteobacteria bacterium]
MNIIRVGVVGTGHLGNYHLQKYKKLPGCEIAGVSDIDEDRVKKAARTCGCPAYTDYRRLIGGVDAVSIAVPTRDHHSVARDFLAAGIDVLLEKPISATLAEADDLITLADKQNLIFQVGFVERFNPAIVALKTLNIKPLFIETHRLHPFFERGTDVDVILDLMIHDLDIILDFVRSPVKSVDAAGVSVLSDKVDISNARITFESGCVANVTASRITAKTMQKIRIFEPTGYHSVDCGKRELLSLGKKNGADGQLKITENKLKVKKLDPLEEEIRSFILSVTNRTPPLVSGKDSRGSLELGLTIIERMKTAQAIIPHVHG